MWVMAWESKPRGDGRAVVERAQVMDLLGSLARVVVGWTLTNANPHRKLHGVASDEKPQKRPQASSTGVGTTRAGDPSLVDDLLDFGFC